MYHIENENIKTLSEESPWPLLQGEKDKKGNVGQSSISTDNCSR
jgi:hypothetical protein